jgi:carboxyl-terminal processing protease
MTLNKLYMKRKIAVIAIALVLFIGLRSNQDRYFEISKNIETFNMLFKELNRHYVDDVDPSELMTIGIEAMLESLDPYTVFLSGAELDNYRMVTTGQYGGIGARIGSIDGDIVVTDPYENFPAYNAGLRAGDKIIEVDGKPTKGYDTEAISEILRGQPGTNVKVKVERTVANKTMDLTIVRGDITIKNVPYFGLISNEIGYIKLSNFAENAGKEVADALTALKEEHQIKGVVLDLRGNGGGLLHEAVNVTNVFVDKGAEVVSTKGKEVENDKVYKTLNKAIDTEIPLVVLTDRGSASASEIVSGSIQDLDRGVVIGQSTFGKGLVQITRPLPYKSKLKVTTSKYYIPSGRCIQAIDYGNRHLDESATQIPDSLRKAFKTQAGRTVLDGAGIDPDISVPMETISNISISLLNNNHIFNYATQFWNANETLRDNSKFKLTDAEFEAFKNYLSDKKYDYETVTEQKLNELKKVTEEENYHDAIETIIKDLEVKILADKKNDLVKFQDEIKRILEIEIVSRYAFEKGRIENSLTDDPDVKEAFKVFSDIKSYNSILAKK